MMGSWGRLRSLPLLKKSCSSCVWNSLVFSYVGLHSECRFLRSLSFCRWWKTENFHVDLAWLVWGPTPTVPTLPYPPAPIPLPLSFPFFSFSYFSPFFFPLSLSFSSCFVFNLFFLAFFSTPALFFPPTFFWVLFVCVCIFVCICVRIWPLFTHMVISIRSKCVYNVKQITN